MSDTPKTDAMMTALLWRTGETLPTDVEFGNFARQLERENAALKEELAPLRETVGVRGDAVTSRDDIDYWSKLVDRADKAVRLETENAALREKAERYRLVTLRQDADNTALCNKLAALENQTQWECSCGGTDCEGMKENAALREDSELLSWLLKRGVCWRDCDKELEGEYWTVGHDTEWLYDQVRGRERIRAAIDAARAKEGQP